LSRQKSHANTKVKAAERKNERSATKCTPPRLDGRIGAPGSRSLVSGGRPLAMRLTLKTEEQHGHDGVVVRGEPVLHLAEAGLGGGAAKQVVDDRPGDNEAADDQRSDRVGGREPELGEPAPAAAASIRFFGSTPAGRTPRPGAGEHGVSMPPVDDRQLADPEVPRALAPSGAH
jgi:hypothetical protein